MSHRITKTFRIEAAHFLPTAPEGHKCRRMHGHSFVVRVHVAGTLDASGWVVDYGVISRLFEPLYEQLDHRLLNDVPGLENPTSEHLATWVYDRLSNTLDGLWGVEVDETCTSSCLYAPSANG